MILIPAFHYILEYLVFQKKMALPAKINKEDISI